MIQFPINGTLPAVPSISRRVRSVNDTSYIYTIFDGQRKPLCMFLIAINQISCLHPTDDEVAQSHFFGVMCADFFAEWQDDGLSKSLAEEQDKCFEISRQWINFLTSCGSFS